MSEKAPFHPACIQPIILFLISNKIIGTQSAVTTPSAMPFILVTIASALIFFIIIFIDFNDSITMSLMH